MPYKRKPPTYGGIAKVAEDNLKKVLVLVMPD